MCNVGARLLYYCVSLSKSPIVSASFSLSVKWTQPQQLPPEIVGKSRKTDICKTHRVGTEEILKKSGL